MISALATVLLPALLASSLAQLPPTAACGAPYTNSNVTAATYTDAETSFCAFAAVNTLSKPRGLVVVGDTVVVVEVNAKIISAHYFADASATTFTSLLAVNASALEPELNHGIGFYAGYLYASSETTVVRWAWDGDRASLPLDYGEMETVITGMPTLADPSVNRHRTRTLLFGADGDLYVSVGSEAIDGTDPDPYRSRILKYPAETLGGTPVVWTSGESVALGTRNAVAIDVRGGTLFSADNGQGGLIDEVYGGDVTPDQVRYRRLDCEKDHHRGASFFDCACPASFSGFCGTS